MESKGIGFKRNLTLTGGSLGVTIPKELVEFLEAKNGTELRMNGFNGKYGKFIAIWNEEIDKRQ